MEKIVFLSLNVRGLANYKKLKDIVSHFWFPPTGTPPHILFLQETHSSKGIEKLWAQSFQTRHVFFSHKTTVSGGLLVVIRNGLPFTLHQQLVSDSYLILHCDIASEEYVLVNVYNRPFALCNFQQNCLDWFNKLWTDVQWFPTHRILMGGDFNLQLDADDKSFFRLRIGCEIFTDFLQETELSDCWSILHPKERQYTFYHKLKGVLGSSRLDYFLVSPLLLNYLSSCSIGSHYQSDHCPVEVTLWRGPNPRGKGIFRFPDHLLDDDSYCEIITDMIAQVVAACQEDSPPILWDRVKLAIQNRTLEYLALSKVRLKDYKQLSVEIQELQGVLDEWIYLEGPLDELVAEIEDKTEQLDHLGTIIDRPRRISNITWSQVFKDTCSKYFFQKVQGIPGALWHMFNSSGVLVSTDREILEICFEFYSDLFAQGNPASCELSNYTTPPAERTLTEEQCQQLAAPITKEDLEHSLYHMKQGKSPGCDGLTVRFYRCFWPVIGDLVFEAIAYAENVGSFTVRQRKGILKLLSKPSKDPRVIKNLRPITLLNVDYKLFTKVLGDHIREVLPSLLHMDQNGFVKNRYMGHNILDIYALMALVEEMDDDNIVLLSLDIEKAFDSVRWDFLRTVLWGFGFPEEFMNRVTLTHQNATVQILNNGHLSETVRIRRGLAQGCGLSPLLFVLVIEGLANMIRADHRIPGIEIRETSKKIAQVADDTLLSFIGSRQVINRIKCVLDHFSQKSG